jgi:type IV pilus assembly protein PilW
MSHVITKQRRQRGVSLIELMVSITIGMVILAAILAVYTSTSSTSKQSESSTRMSEDAAVALNYIGGYIRMAGFSIPLANVSANTVVFGTGTMETADRSFMGAGIRGCDTGFTNPTATTTVALTCNTGTGTAAISVRFQGDTSNTSPAAGSPSDCLNQAVTGLTASDFDGGSPYTLIESRFYVKTASNSGTPELFCGGNGNATYTAQPIMQYVENLAFTYGVADDVSARQATSYLTAAQVDALPASTMDQRWSRVVSVKICLVMRSELRDQNAPGSYRNCAGNVVASPNNYLRRSFQTVVALRNRSGFSS